MPSGEEQFYQKLHEFYYPLKDSANVFLNSARFAKCLSIMQKYRPRTILDVGFEDPILSKTIIKRVGAKYTGIDISEISVREAVSSGLNAIKLDISTNRLPFEDESFEFVYASEVIEHLYDPDFAIEEFKRVLNSHGKLLITTPNLGAWFNRLLLLLGIQPWATEVSTVKNLGRHFSFLGQGGRPVGHIRVFTHRALVDFIILHGFRPISLEGYRTEGLRRLLAIDNAFSRFPPLASGIIALAEKRP